MYRNKDPPKIGLRKTSNYTTYNSVIESIYLTTWAIYLPLSICISLYCTTLLHIAELIDTPNLYFSLLHDPTLNS